ncbi:MAG: CoA-binding protein [Clostridia bacterium]|nr:CoA-binding protein [Clostridia bacterium]
MKASKKNIEDFLSNKDIAVVGASAKSKKFGNDVIKELVAKGYNVYPVHPTAKEIEGINCFDLISNLPDHVSAMHISTNKNLTNDIVINAKNKGIKMIWVQQMSDNDETPSLCNECNLIVKECIFMFLEPVKGLHKFHKGVKGLFGKLPK